MCYPGRLEASLFPFCWHCPDKGSALYPFKLFFPKKDLPHRHVVLEFLQVGLPHVVTPLKEGIFERE